VSSDAPVLPWQAARAWLARECEVRLGRDLAIAGADAELHAGRTLAALVCGALVGPAALVGLQVGGIAVSMVVPAWLALAGALAGVAVVQVTLRQRAAGRRREFAHALGAYLDLLALLLAADEGTEGALAQAADAGHGWAFDELRGALRDARTHGRPMWAALDELGERLDVRELREIAASAQLGGSEGAAVRRSLIAKARSLRATALADAETHARARSKQMALPLVAIAVAFLVFLFYPAIAQLTSS
jgi:Flp pilus assembly protein TadB